MEIEIEITLSASIVPLRTKVFSNTEVLILVMGH